MRYTITRAPANFEENCWVTKMSNRDFVFWGDFAYGWGYPLKNQFFEDFARASVGIDPKLARGPGNDLPGLPLNFGAWGCPGSRVVAV